MNDIAASPLMAWLLANPLLGPFAEFGFMRNALLGCVALSLSAAPVGVFLMLRRMSLTGDAMAHAILPGAAIGYLVSGLSLTAMTIGGIVAGLPVAVGSGPGGAQHGAARRHQPGRVLPAVARAGRAHRLGARQQRGPAACAVRHRARTGQRGAHAAGRHRRDHAGVAAPCSTARWCWSAWTRVSCARSAAGARWRTTAFWACW